MKKFLSRIMIAGVNSSAGKTTVTCALLGALVNRKMSVAGFKCGPDYIDPMFHKKVLGTDSSNMDIFLTGEKNTKYLLGLNSENKDIAVIEGVMGFYDGLSGTTDVASSRHVSEITDTPVILVVDGKGTSLSICAVIKGFLEFRQNNIKAVILNRVTESTYKLLKRNIEENTSLPVVGYLPLIPDAAIESRQLGLVTAMEIRDLKSKVSLLAETAESTLDIEKILELANSVKPLIYEETQFEKITDKAIAVAFDPAFCFYYADSLRLLEMMGAKIKFFSPLEDEELPNDVCALILGGGYPELYLEKLSGNRTMVDSIRKAVLGGMPTIAECGGFMYLHESMDGFPLCGVIKGKTYTTDRLNRFGYVKLTAKSDNLLCKKGDSVNAHEFHYTDCDNSGTDFVAEKPNSSRTYDCIHASGNLFAGYPHINFWGNPQFAKNFLSRVNDF